jgi:hypothetical protein
MKRLSARARKVQNKIISNDSRCIPFGTIVIPEEGIEWLTTDENGLMVLIRR